MRKFAGTWIAVAIFGALLVWLLVGKPKSKDERDEAAMTVVSAERDAIDRIAISSSAGRVVLEKAGTAWSIVDPVAYPVEDAASSQMLNALASLVATDLVWKEPTAAQRAQAGLAPPATTVTFRAGGKEKTLLLGKTFTKGDSVYVSAGGNAPVFLARKWSVDVFGKSPDDYRRRKLFVFERDDVRSLSLEGAGGTITMTREDALAPWRVTEPFQGRADRGKANGVIAKLSNLRAETFVPADAPGHPMGKPGGEVSFTTADGARHTLVVGAWTGAPKGDEDIRWHARVGTAGQVVIVTNPLPLDLEKDFSAWRDPSLFDFVVDDVETLELVLDGETIGVRRDAEKMWLGHLPQAGTLVNPEATAFLRQVKQAKSTKQGVPAPPGSAAEKVYGLDAPALSGSWVTRGEKFELTVGKFEGSSTARWMRTHESPVPQLVDVELIGPARALRDAVKRPPATPAASPSPAASSSRAATEEQPGHQH